MGRMGSLQMTPQAHVKGDCNAHHDQGTHTQDQEPPDHPHSRLGYQMMVSLRIRTGTHVWEHRQHWPHLACRSALFCRIISTRLAKSCRRSRPYLVRVATSSRLWKACGSPSFSRNSFRMGCSLAKIRNISPLNAGSRKSSSFRTPFRTNEAVILK